MSSYALPIPSVAGSLESYIQTINSFPILTQAREVELARRFRRENDLEAARELVLSHLRVVVAIARGYMGYGLPQADLIQEGNIGLMKAVKRFDPERGVRLVSFAVHWIRAEMHEFILRNWRMVKIATTKAQRKLFFNLRSLKQGLNTLGAEEVKAIARQLGVKPEEVVEMETRLGGQDIALEPLSDDDDDAYAPIAYLAAEDAEPGRLLEHQQTARLRGEGLEKALDTLDARSRRIIEARWLNEKASATLHDLAAEFGVSAERIRQIEVKALAKMKGVIAAAA
ncbi:MAG: RNA polymerase factor sigma-32 [Betaproteobacteria bacterium RIFCSPLOWO2_12_FULL_62_58]|nr:MAG: RNA polymerase factor sigma-32 [Betaproteobacteria bacterium RIFCSPLOWO2_02_FULL_62_79]OGA48023.1 MAG: RNA polymerase factor sigma-32 [Betaproteobacteria bacterium RIFCSPLOWO2_12_FULL_62_58]